MKKAIQIIPENFRRRGIGVACTLFLRAVLNMVGLAMLLPVLALALDPQSMEVLGVKLPRVVVPLNPGKNITVIAEVVAMNHLLKYAGVDSAALFNQRLMQRMGGAAEYLEEDYE